VWIHEVQLGGIGVVVGVGVGGGGRNNRCVQHGEVRIRIDERLALPILLLCTSKIRPLWV